MRLINEFKTFVWNNWKAEAMRGYNDDLVMACAIASWIRETALVANYKQTEYKKALLGGIMTTRMSFNTKIKGMAGYKNKNKKGSYSFNNLPFFMK